MIILHRVLGAAALVACTTAAALAADGPALRGDVTASRDTLTLGDLVLNAPAASANVPLFRAPALGQTGTIQTKRIVAAAEALGLRAVETAGRLEVTVSRAARHVGTGEIEAALKKRLASEFGADPLTTGISFDGQAPVLLASPDTGGDLGIADLVLDRRSRRLQAVAWLGPSATERRAQIRVTGSLVELVPVAVAARALERGQAIDPSDIAIERRPRDMVPADAVFEGASVGGRVARRAFGAGALVRPADLARPDLVNRGDMVTVVYEGHGIALSLRAKATQSGALGDTVLVTNPQSKKDLQAVVVAPGKVSVTAAAPGRLAAATGRASASRPGADR